VATELVEVGVSLVEALERGDTDTVRAASRFPEWDGWGDWVEHRWRPRLEDLTGPVRTVSGGHPVHDRMVRVILDGERGQAFVSVLFEDGKLAGVGIDENDKDGRFAVVVGATRRGARPLSREELDAQYDQLRAFYAPLVRGRLGFDEGGGPAPRWRDPAHPAQVHLDVQVDDLEAAEVGVLGRGATKVEDFGEWRVYEDPAGHPFCLYPGLSGAGSGPGKLMRVVIDCPDPAVLAHFWGGLLDMRRRVEDSPDRIVIGDEDADRPMIGLQRVTEYQPPKWPDSDYPDHMHFDIGFDDRPARERLARELGATRLPPQGGSCPVYADPAGHPFCLCYKGE